VAPRLHELPQPARRAVLGVVSSFLREDAGELDEALRQSPRALADAA
jgi:hypothetical protein